VYEGEKDGLAAVSRMLVGKALAAAFTRHFPDAYADEDVGDAEPRRASVYDAVVGWFRSGQDLALDDHASDAEHLGRLSEVKGLAALVRKHTNPRDDAELASLMELVLEGLHQGSLLSRDDDDDGSRLYGDMLAQMARGLDR
jgi:magnesium chelatase subunit I